MAPGGRGHPDNWYHGPLSREVAEDLLRNDGENGSFLVRQSTTVPNDFALSVFHEREVIHIQIRRHNSDAFFSIDGEKVIQGLDELINFYTTEEEILYKNQTIHLTKPILGTPPPSDCKLHGASNILHRSVKEGDLNVVRHLVDDKSRSLEARNEEGQTAIHLACINGHLDILKILKSAQCNLNPKDSFHYTPLHYACMKNHPLIVKFLMSHGNTLVKCDPTIRTQGEKPDWVPLHEAASRGNLECVKILLEYHAPLRPRTQDDKLPIDLAFEAGQRETVEYLRNYKPPRPMGDLREWYHHNLTRQESEELLRVHQNSPDSRNRSYFLIRYSKDRDIDVLDIISETGLIRHFGISKTNDYLHISSGPFFENLEEVVNHYSRWADGLPVNLQGPIRPQSQVQLSPPPLPRRTPRSSPNGYSFNTFHSTNNNPEYSIGNEDIPSDFIVLGEQLGEGEFGLVYKAKLNFPGKNPVTVAVKKLFNEVDEYAKIEFFREARIMLEMDHENIVRLVGFCQNPEIYMVQELMELGSMRDYIVDHVSEVQLDDLKLWALQISTGMVYLQERKFVHRDLAARNILLASVTLAKISDFGLSRALNPDKDYYTASKGGRWPIKWYAPECCNFAQFSHASDVWSFGVTLWEMFSFGDIPYGNLPGPEVISLVDEKDVRLKRPERCPENVYKIMRRCWERHPVDRITFHELEEFFQNLEFSRESDV